MYEKFYELLDCAEGSELMSKIIMEVFAILEVMADEDDIKMYGKVNRVPDGDTRTATQKINDALDRLVVLLDQTEITEEQKSEIFKSLDQLLAYRKY